jgi:hypothetical protein
MTRPGTLITLFELTLRWRCSESTIRRLVRAGQLTPFRLFDRGMRFSEAQIVAFERENSLPGRNEGAAA